MLVIFAEDCLCIKFGCYLSTIYQAQMLHNQAITFCSAMLMLLNLFKHLYSLHLSQMCFVPGMGAKLTTYYRRSSPTDNDHQRLMKGTLTFALVSLNQFEA